MLDPGGTTPSGRPIRVLYIVSQSVRWLSFEWVAGGLDRNAFALSFLLLSKGPPPLGPHLSARGVDVTHLPFAGRHAVPWAAGAVARHCRSRGIEIVHAHFMDSCLAGLTGAYMAGIPVRIHTRHHAGPYPIDHRAPWGRLYDRWNNRLSTAVIAPSEQARSALVEHDKIPPEKVVLIHHGFDLAALGSATDADALLMRRKYGLGDDRPIVGVVARYERIKGVEHVILAFRRLLARYPRARLVLVNSRGRRAGPIRRLLGTIPQNRYTEIRFEEEMASLYKTFDVFIHAPIRRHLEGFGQVYVEAMAAGIPCVCSIAGVAAEFISDGNNAIVVNPGDSDHIYDGIIRVLEDADLRQRLVTNARHSIESRFGVGLMLRSLQDLYLRLHKSHGRGAKRA
jgi:glycosyltransferase involved in cell wall biosynthesis